MTEIHPENYSDKDMCAAQWWSWIDDPGSRLRQHVNGTLFLLRLNNGRIHLCRLAGNLTTDISLKARRLDNGACIRLETKRAASFIVFDPDDKVRIRLSRLKAIR